METYYSKTHEWVKIKADGNEAIVGITKYAVENLLDISYIELPELDKDLIVDEISAKIESGESNVDVHSPLSGTVMEINDELEDSPELLAKAPETYGWLYRLENIDTDELEDLMDKNEYMEYLKSL